MSDVAVPSSERRGALKWLAMAAGAIAVGGLVIYHIAAHGHDASHEVPHAPALWGLGVIPFVAILAAISIFPLLHFTHRWWESNRHRLIVSLGCAGLTILYYAIAMGPASVLPMLDHAIPGEYIPFIVLLFSLYVISGGISLTGDLAARPITNTAFLAFGAVIASLIGTTGASMLLIRPILKTNHDRRFVVHTVIFFIFLVSNIGGTLLPIGDPPLFLGFLRGVPFFWTLGLWKQWALCCGILLVVYYIWDTVAYRRESPIDVHRDRSEQEPLRLRGCINILWLAGVVACVAFIQTERPLPGTNWTPFPFLRELVMLGLTGLSILTTPAGVREANKFNYAAIGEVAALFVGIFVAMQVPIAVLNANGEALLEIMNQPWNYFWATGTLSSVLDNAPTYVVFFELGKLVPTADGVPLGPAAMYGTIAAPVLVGISLGAVFMGAMTYIGNGPNFMVKAIAEQSGVKMPSFFGYMFKYSLPILVPVFIIVTIFFLDGGSLTDAGVAAEPAVEAAAAPH